MYVDEGYIAYSSGRVCFMAADTDEELHEMASRIGVRKETFPHGRSHIYSIPEEAKNLAVLFGAKEVERSVILARLRR